MARGINTRTTPRKPTFRRSISRSRSRASDSTSRVRTGSKRKSPSAWRGGKTFGGATRKERRESSDEETRAENRPGSDGRRRGVFIPRQAGVQAAGGEAAKGGARRRRPDGRQ